MVKEKAYAKINLYLDILGKRLDSYHDLEMVMAPIDLHDLLTFKKTSEPGIHLTTSVPITETPEQNLVYQIAQDMMKTHDIPFGVNIHIEKRIPIAAGLGGGSADGAATLRGLNKLFKLKMSMEELADIAEKFGSDIPFGIYNQLCIARGKGEQLFFLKKHLKLPVLIITPKFPVSTQKVFESVVMDLVPKSKITGMTNAIFNCNYDLIIKELYNALEPFTFKIFKDVLTLKSDIEAFQVDGVLMSGSGPSLFVLHQDAKHLKEINNHFSGDYFTELTKIR